MARVFFCVEMTFIDSFSGLLILYCKKYEREEKKNDYLSLWKIRKSFSEKKDRIGKIAV